MKKYWIMLMAVILLLPGEFALARESGQDAYLSYRIAAGAHHAAAILSDGKVVAAGENEDGQCNVQDWADIVQVAAGEGHTVGLKADGTAIAVGRNDHGQCNVENWTDIVFIACGDEHTVGLRKDGTVAATGILSYDGGRYDNADCNPCAVEAWKDVAMLAAGGHTTMAVTKGCDVLVSGEMEEDIVDDIPEETGMIPKKILSEMPLQIAVVGNECLLYLYDDGTVDYDGLPLALYPKEMDMCSHCNPGVDRWLDFSPHNPDLWMDIVEVFAGGYHLYGLKSDGTVVVAGDEFNPYGSSIGLHEPAAWENIVSMAVGKDFVIGVDRWGKMLYAGLPLGELSGAALWQDVDFAAAASGFAAAVLDDGSVNAWSAEEALWLFWDALTECAAWQDTCFLTVSEDLELVAGIDKNGAILLSGYHEYTQNDLAAALQKGKAKKLSVYGDQVLVLTENGDVFFLGGNDTMDVSVFAGARDIAFAGDYALALMEDGGVQSSVHRDPLWYLKAPSENGSLLPAYIAASHTEEWRDVVSFAIGGEVSYGLTGEGKVLIAGETKYGQEAALDWDGIIAISASPYHIAGLKADGTVVAAGWNEEMKEEGWGELDTKNQCDVEHWKNVKQVIAVAGGTIGICHDGSVLYAGAGYADVSACLSWRLFDGEYVRRDGKLKTESARLESIQARKAANERQVRETLSFLRQDNDASNAVLAMHPEYEKVYAFHNGYAMVEKDGLFGLVDESGEEILPPVYDFMNRACDATVFASSSDWLYGFFAEDTGVLIPPAFGAAQDFEGNYVKVMLPDESEGYVSRQGERISEKEYKALHLPEYQPEKSSLSLYVLDDYWESYEGAYGYTDEAGNIVIEPIFQLAWEFEDGLARVNLWGYDGSINEKGEIVCGFEGLEARLTEAE